MGPGFVLPKQQRCSVTFFQKPWPPPTPQSLTQFSAKPTRQRAQTPRTAASTSTGSTGSSGSSIDSSTGEQAGEQVGGRRKKKTEGQAQAQGQAQGQEKEVQGLVGERVRLQLAKGAGG